VQDAGLDDDSCAYSATLLGSSLNWSGADFSFGNAGSLGAVTGATIPLPPGNGATVSLLATGANGAQKNQVFIITYTGSTSSFTQSLSDWFAPQKFHGANRRRRKWPTAEESQRRCLPWLCRPPGDGRHCRCA
jgi:hypothetical protein